MKISFVTTVLNEEKTIGALLDSLPKQTKKPDEIIVVDGGSTDRTLSMISDFTSEEPKSLLRHHPRWINKKVKFKVFIKPNTTIAQGRNYGIRKATGDIIAMSDVGCVLHKDWLDKITKPFFKENVDIVAGFYRMTGSTALQKALGLYLGTAPQRFDLKTFLPSARSIAFKKSLWEKIGGFDEGLDRAGEDTLFNYEAIKLNARFVRVKDALVDWEVPNNLWEAALKFYYYAKGDAESGICWHPLQRMSTHNLKIFSLYFRYLVGLTWFILSFKYELVARFLPVVVLIYLVWPIWKMRDLVTDSKTRLWLPVIQIVSDIAVLLGTSLGILRRH